MPAPIAASLVEQLGHEAEDPALLGWLLAQVVAIPPTVGHPWLEGNVAVVEKVVVVVAVKTPPTATFVRVLVPVWVDSESVPEPIKNPPRHRQQNSTRPPTGLGHNRTNRPRKVVSGKGSSKYCSRISCRIQKKEREGLAVFAKACTDTGVPRLISTTAASKNIGWMEAETIRKASAIR